MPLMSLNKKMCHGNSSRKTTRGLRERIPNTARPGLLVEAMRRDNWSDQQVGLLATYVAARSLPCWYLYCDDSMPYESCQYALEYWGWRYQNADAQTVPSEFLEAAVPKDDSGIIDDCRYTDTISASKACSSSSRFIASRDDYDAVCAVFHSYCAYDVHTTR